MPDGLYDADFFLWTQEQARLLRNSAHAATNLPLDWENLAEEVEDLGRSNRRELRNRLRVVMEHLLKLQHFEIRRASHGLDRNADQPAR